MRTRTSETRLQSSASTGSLVLAGALAVGCWVGVYLALMVAMLLVGLSTAGSDTSDWLLDGLVAVWHGLALTAATRVAAGVLRRRGVEQVWWLVDSAGDRRLGWGRRGRIGVADGAPGRHRAGRLDRRGDVVGAVAPATRRLTALAIDDRRSSGRVRRRTKFGANSMSVPGCAASRMRAAARAVGTVVAVAVLAGCSGGATAEVPDGYQLIEHPQASVAIPEAWSRTEKAQVLKAEPEAAVYVEDDAPEGMALGASLWRYSEPMPPQGASVALRLILAEFLGLPGFEELSNEPIEVTGADDAQMVVARLDAPEELGGFPVRTVFIGAQDGDRVMIFRLIGDDDTFTDEDVAVARRTLRVSS